MFLNILIVLIAIGFVIFIHELGHFCVAKFFGVKIEKFSIGFGKEIFGWTRQETRYSLAVFPLGGFVKMQGENLFGKIEKDKIVEGDFINLHYFKRILVVSAGAIMNIIFAVSLVFFITWISGIYLVDKADLSIGAIFKNSPAQIAGIKKNDVLKSVNGNKISSWDDLFHIFKNHDGKSVEIVVLRNNEELAFKINPRFEKETNRYILGISANVQHKKVSFIEGLDFTYKYFLQITKGFVNTLLGLFTRKEKEGELIGPIGVIRELSVAINQGFLKFLFLLAIVSFNLGLINLVPLPILDGGHILIYFFEWLSGKQINQKILEFAFVLMSITLILLMVFLTNKDITRLFGGD